MAEKQATEKPAAEKKEIAQIQKYPRGELQANAGALFGVRPEVVAGALHGNNKAKFTLDEMRKLIDSFLKRRVV